MNAATETSESFAAPATAPRPVRPFYWSVRRELWENRSLFIAPLVAGAIVLFALIMRSMHLSGDIEFFMTLPEDRQGPIVSLALTGIGFVISLVMNITVFFYALDALQGERKDKSVLFWKSMPVSDTTTVLSKVFTALAVSGAVVVVVTLITQIAVLLLATVILMISGTSPGAIWGSLQLIEVTISNIYAQIAMALWYAPVVAWLLLVSAWAKRVTFLWAVFVPVGAAVFERVAIGTHYIRDMLTYRLQDGVKTAFTPAGERTAKVILGGDGQVDSNLAIPGSLSSLDPVGFVSNPWLWVGLLVAAALIAAAIWMRRYREPI
jgi:ABC-2 type transport system permease protein